MFSFNPETPFFSNSNKMSSKKSEKPATIDSACHIIKGAIVKVLKAPITVSVEAPKIDEGRITIQFDRDATKSEIEKIEKLTNEKIIQNFLKLKF